MKKISAIFLAIILSFGSFGFMGTNRCYASAGPVIISSGSSTSRTLIKKQYSKSYLPAVMFDPGAGPAGSSADGFFKFYPEETGDYTVTIAKSYDDMGGEFFSVAMSDDYNNDVYSNPMETGDSCQATISVTKGMLYKLGIMGASYGGDRVFDITFDKPLIAPLTYTAGVGGSVTGETTQIVSPDGTGTEVTAVANDGYTFSRWSDGVTTPSRTDDYSADGMDVTAWFMRIDPIDNIAIDGLSVTLPRATVRENGVAITGKTVKYTCAALTDYGATISSSDRWMGLGKDTPTGTYTVTVSLQDNSAEPITFDIIFTKPIEPYIELTPASVDLVRDGTDTDFYVEFPAKAFYDSKGDIKEAHYEIMGGDFVDYVTEEPTENGFKLSKDIPLGTYHLTYGLSDDDTITKDFEMIVRNPEITYTAEAGGSIIGEVLQSVEPGANGTAVTAVAEDGYVFLQWSDGVTTPSRTDENITGDMSVTAVFAESAVEVSSDNTLSDLTVDGTTIPSFDSSITTYDLGSTTNSSIVVHAVLNDINATVAGDIGTQNLSIGSNTLTITVTAEDNLIKEYVLRIAREAEENGEDGTDTIAKVATPTATPNGCYFKVPQNVTLTSTTTGSSIYFTLDGSEPTGNSDIYTEPIVISKTTTLKAIACLTGTTTSSTFTATFTKKSTSTDSSSSGSSSSDSTSTGGAGSSATNTKNDNTVTGQADSNRFTVGTKDTATNRDGKSETVVSVNASAIEAQVEKLEKGEIISIPVTGATDVFRTQLSIQSIEDMQKKDVVLEVKMDGVSYQLPTGLIDITSILDLVGEDVDPREIPFNIEISKTNEDMVKVVEMSAEENGLAIVVSSIDFKLEASYKGETYEVNKFKSFVTRTIEVPAEVDAGKITTAIVTNADGSIRHVPTIITEVDGKYFATINSLTNSTYTLIHNEVTFSDVTDGFWAKEDIEKMASRLVVEGKEDGTFLPSESVTRAEVAQVLVKALGLDPTEVNQFVDVESGTKYAGYIGTAYNYGIIKGTSETTFNPNGLVTRQDAMAMIYRAGKIAGLENETYTANVTQYEDFNDVSEYAKEAVEWNISNSIIFGKSDTKLAPFDNITRAELTVIANRLLTSAGLID